MKKYVLVLALLTLTVFLISACSDKNQAGQAFKPTKQVGGDLGASCGDTDNGRNYEVKGRVNGKDNAGSNYNTWDTCNPNGKLIEGYCQANKNKEETVDCVEKFGAGYACEDGRCVEQVPLDDCFDSDGSDYTNKGFVTLTNSSGNFTSTDFCNGNGQLIEFLCNGTQQTFQTIFCPNEFDIYYGCIDGACVYGNNETGGNDTGGNDTGGNETAVCGNGVVEAGEECDDGSNGVNTDQCNDDCTFTVCGDAIRQTPNGNGLNERCDGGDTGSEDCTDYAFDGGVLGCLPTCTWYDFSGCFNGTSNGSNGSNGTG